MRLMFLARLFGWDMKGKSTRPFEHSENRHNVIQDTLVHIQWSEATPQRKHSWPCS